MNASPDNVARLEPAEPQAECILVIDDDPVFRAMFEQVLIAHGATEVAFAGDGEEACDILRRRRGEIGVVTLDLSMPRLDGVAFLRRASEAGYHGRLVLVSGEHKSVIASAGKLASMLGLDYAASFSKPVDFHRLATYVLAPRPAAPERQPAPPLDVDEINAGLRHSRLMAFYQPRIDLRNMTLIGAEALARMRNEQGQLLDAGQMINLAEENGRISDITWRMIEIVCEDSVRLRRELLAPLRISFNVSAAILCNPQLPDQLGEIVRLSGLKPTDFILELTESRIPADMTRSLEALTRLRMMGFGLAIDDFGTGYSNIEQLRTFPFTELKIDKSFMMSALRDGFAFACIEASISLARELGMRVIVEGVETAEALRLAQSNGVDEAQGYYFGKPMPVDDLIAFTEDFMRHGLRTEEPERVRLAS